MPPEDPTPLGDAMTHRFPQQKIPQRQPVAGTEDEDSDPVVETGPGINDGPDPLKKQRG